MNAATCFVPSHLAEMVLNNQGIMIARKELDLPLTKTMHGKFRYPLMTMEVGQHFFVPSLYRSVPKTQNSVTSSVGHAQRNSTRRFHQRRYPTGIRVWRIA